MTAPTAQVGADDIGLFMIDRKTETGIKSLKDFLEIWGKFHSLYDGLTSKDIITEDDEKKFLEARGMVTRRYDDLRSSLDFHYAPHSRMTDPVSDVLSFENARFVSEKNLKKLNDDWRDSYVFLNNILERLKSRKRRLGGFNPVGVFFKRISERRGAM